MTWKRKVFVQQVFAKSSSSFQLVLTFAFSDVDDPGVEKSGMQGFRDAGNVESLCSIVPALF
jgi:hypothetical protein